MARFLFLQGTAARFWRALGDGLLARGHGVERLTVSGGDRLFWGRDHRIDWNGGTEGFDTFLRATLAAGGFTAIVLFGDCRPLHRIAIAAARAMGVAVWVFEEGYLRPHWITLERDGVNGYSRLPRDPDWYRATAARLPPETAAEPVGSGLWRRIGYDFVWQGANHALRPWYPRYRTHRPYPIWAEYATWARRLSTLYWRGLGAERTARRLAGGDRPFFLFPLQLDPDSQVRAHSPFGGIAPVLESVIRSFAHNAPRDAVLAVKNHPLDNGWIDYRRMIRKLAGALGVAERVVFLDGAPLDALLDRAAGVITINSTVGATALERGKPVIALGAAIYDLPGLTTQGPLGDFWRRPAIPDATLWRDFRRVLIEACLVNGNYYTDEGVRIGVTNAIQRLESDRDMLAEAPRDRPSLDHYRAKLDDQSPR